jgi:hypothetical protein
MKQLPLFGNAAVYLGHHPLPYLPTFFQLLTTNMSMTKSKKRKVAGTMEEAGVVPPSKTFKMEDLVREECHFLFWKTLVPTDFPTGCRRCRRRTPHHDSPHCSAAVTQDPPGAEGGGVRGSEDATPDAAAAADCNLFATALTLAGGIKDEDGGGQTTKKKTNQE